MPLHCVQYSIAAIVAYFGTPDGMVAFAKETHLCPDLVNVLEAQEDELQVPLSHLACLLGLHSTYVSVPLTEWWWLPKSVSHATAYP